MKFTPKNKRTVDEAARGISRFEQQQLETAGSKAHTQRRMEEAHDRIQRGLEVFLEHGNVKSGAFVLTLNTEFDRDDLGAIATTVNTLERVRDFQFAGTYQRGFNGRNLVSVACPVSKLQEICGRFGVALPENIQNLQPGSPKPSYSK